LVLCGISPGIRTPAEEKISVFKEIPPFSRFPTVLFIVSSSECLSLSQYISPKAFLFQKKNKTKKT